MKQTDFRDVPDELRERIETLLAPFKRKRSGGSRPLSRLTVLAGILYKCRSGCQWAMFPACYGQKALFTSTCRCAMASDGWLLAASSSALSKNQRLRASGAILQTENEAEARSISIWMVGVFLLE